MEKEGDQKRERGEGGDFSCFRSICSQLHTTMLSIQGLGAYRSVSSWHSNVQTWQLDVNFRIWKGNSMEM